MRKHSARKWLHFVLDLLPLVLIPVFMIYSHRHDVAQDFEITTQEAVYYDTNDVEDINDFYVGNAYYWEDNWITTPVSQTYICFAIEITDNLPFARIQDTVGIDIFYLNTGDVVIKQTFLDSSVSYPGISGLQFAFVLKSINSTTGTNYLLSHISRFDYLVKEYQPVITNIPKDVMTSFLERFNNTIDNYFNMSSVFNMGDIYNWLNVNMFGGSAPMVISSIYNIIVYEFIMDLIFLMYSIFMFIIDFSQELLSRCFSFSRHGGCK